MVSERVPPILIVCLLAAGFLALDVGDMLKAGTLFEAGGGSGVAAALSKFAGVPSKFDGDISFCTIEDRIE